MRLGIFFLILAVFSLRAETISFVGAPHSVVKSDFPCEFYLSGPESEVVCMNVAFNLKYDVLEWFSHGEAPDNVEFVGFYHFTGLPSYTAFSQALVIVEKRNSHYLLKKILPVVNVDSEDTYICIKEKTMVENECSQIQSLISFLAESQI